MNLKRRYNLWKVKRVSTPSDIFKHNLQKKLEVALVNKYKVEIFWFQTRVFKFTAAIMVVVILAGSFGTGTYAYYSPEVVEGNVLYPVKNTIEKIEEKTKRTPESQAKFYLKQIQRREAEKIKMEEKQKVVENLDVQIEKIGNKLEQINNKIKAEDLRDKKLKPQIESKLQERKQILEENKLKIENKKKGNRTTSAR